jgi:hypothetical protein
LSPVSDAAPGANSSMSSATVRRPAILLNLRVFAGCQQERRFSEIYLRVVITGHSTKYKLELVV